MSETLTESRGAFAREDHRCRRASLDQRRHQGTEEVSVARLVGAFRRPVCLAEPLAASAACEGFIQPYRRHDALGRRAGFRSGVHEERASRQTQYQPRDPVINSGGQGCGDSHGKRSQSRLRRPSTNIFSTSSSRSMIATSSPWWSPLTIRSAAAAEIRRIGHLPNVVAVFMPLLNILMGQKHYYPIYEAAESLRLPILIHPTGTEGGFPTAVAFAGGTPSTYIERHTNFPEIGMSSINSMIFEGVFYRFPGLKLLAAEFGFSWLPHFLWRMDQNWHQFRKEVPWVKERTRAKPCLPRALHVATDGRAGEAGVSHQHSRDDPCRSHAGVQHGLSALGQ